MRTNIEIDDELMRKAMAASGAATKKAAVEEALELMVKLKSQGQAFQKLWGSVVWRGHDDDWFASDEEILEKRRLEALKADSEEPGISEYVADEEAVAETAGI